MTIDKDTSRRIIGIVTISLLIAWAVGHLDNVPTVFNNIKIAMTPLIIGAVLAFVLNIPMRWFENKYFGHEWKSNEKNRKKLARPLSITFVVVVALVIVVLVIFLVVPDIVKTIKSFIQDLPNTLQDINDWYQKFAQENPELFSWLEGSSFTLNNLMSRFVDWLTNKGSQIAGGLLAWIQGAVNGVFNFFMGIIFTIYYLARKETLLVEFKAISYALFPENFVDKLLQLGSLNNIVFGKFFTGQALESLIKGSMTFIAMLIFKFPFPITISVLQIVGSFIPIIGAFVATTIGAVLVLVESSFWDAFIFVIMIVVIQQIEGNFVYPKVMGSQVGLPSFWVFVTVIIAAKTMSILETIMSVPVATVIYLLIKSWTKQRIPAKGIDYDKVLNNEPHYVYEDVTDEDKQADSSENTADPEADVKKENMSRKTTAQRVVSLEKTADAIVKPSRNRKNKLKTTRVDLADTSSEPARAKTSSAQAKAQTKTKTRAETNLATDVREDHTDI